MFKTRSSHEHNLSSTAGEKMAIKHRLEIQDNGAQILVEDGYEDIYEPIQLGAEEAKISNIVARVSYGDQSALNQRAAQYFDATELPDNLKDAMDLMAAMPAMAVELEKLKQNKPEQEEHNQKEVTENAAE